MPAPAAVDTRDDSRHALVSRAHAPAQTDLDAYAAGAGRRRARMLDASSTRFAVQEVTARSALTACKLPGMPWSLNPYTGCSHDCVYCYVPQVARLERDRWGTYVVVKRNLPTVLAREVRVRTPREVFLSSATDPYQPAEGVHQVTRRCLDVLLRAGWAVRVLTRNPLVTRDIDILSRFDSLEVGLSIPTVDDAARRVLEPGAPTVAARLRTVRALADAGLSPFVNLAPAYPFTSDLGPRETAEALRDAGASVVYAWPWRYLDDVLPSLRTRTEDTRFAAFVDTVPDAAFARRQFRALAAACRRAGLAFKGGGERVGSPRGP